jgi:hypothetical protein
MVAFLTIAVFLCVRHGVPSYLAALCGTVSGYRWVTPIIPHARISVL